MGNDMDHQAGISQLADCHTHPFVSSVCLWQSVHLLVRQRHSTDVSTEWLQCAGFVMPNSRLCWLPRRSVRHSCWLALSQDVLRCLVGSVHRFLLSPATATLLVLGS